MSVFILDISLQTDRRSLDQIEFVSTKPIGPHLTAEISLSRTWCVPVICSIRAPGACWIDLEGSSFCLSGATDC